jgi:hypothetical protein
MKSVVAVFCLLSVALWLNPTASATDVCGSVSGTWNLAGSPYNVTCNVTVPTGQTLIIEAGVQVVFMGHYTLLVNGTLSALGTETDSVVFTTNTVTNPARWHGLRLESATNASALHYCIIENARFNDGNPYSSGGGLTIWHCSPMVEHCTIRNNSSVNNGGGLVVDYTDSNPAINYCTIRNNTSVYGGGAAISNGAHTTFTYCLITSNSVQQGGGVGSWGGYPTLINCTVTANHGDDAGGIRGTSSAIITLINCIVANNTGIAGIANYSSNTLVVRYSDIYGNQGSAAIGDCGANFGNLDHVNIHGDPCDVYFNLFMNPMFVNAAGGNYYLAGASPCINAGDPSSTHDPDGSIADMGAFWNSDNPEPVSLTSFSAALASDGVHVRFAVASELDNARFEIWRSASQDGRYGKVAELASQGNSSDEHRYEYVDRDIVAGQAYSYFLADVDLNGQRVEHRELTQSVTVTGSLDIPMDYALAAYPNPFNPSTTILFSLAESGVARVTVYDMAGRVVRELVNGHLIAGAHTISFSGAELPSGVYFARMESAGISRIQKLLLLK